MTRMELARRRLKLARYAIGVTAAGAFAAFAVAARDSHPGTQHASSASSSSSSSSQTAADDTTGSFEFDGSASFGGASTAPAIQSGGS
jgi:hypothetical protein